MSVKIFFSLLILAGTFGHAADFPIPDFSNPKKWVQLQGAQMENAGNSIIFQGPGQCNINFEPYFKNSEKFRHYKGIGFRIKGDGGKHRFTFAVSDGKFRFSLMLDGNEWQDVKLAWSDFVNYSRDPSLELGRNTINGLPAEGIFQMQLGDHWKLYHHNSRIQPYRIEISDLRLLEEVAPIDILKVYPQKNLDTFRTKAKSGKRVLVYCHGDSITAGTGVGENRYPNFLQEKLRKHYNNPRIEVKTIAVGSAQSADLRVWARSDFQEAETPDLVTVMIGYNDRWLAIPSSHYKHSVTELYKRINSYTQGAPFILFSPAPGMAERFEMQSQYASVIREIASEHHLPCFDLNAILKEYGLPKLHEYFLDRAHPNTAGHRLISEKLFEFITGEK